MPALRSSPGRDRAHDFRQMAKPALVIGDERAPYRRSLIAPDLAKQSRELAVQTIQSALFGTSNPTHLRSEEHTSELQSLMRISYAVFCLKKNKTKTN